MKSMALFAASALSFALIANVGGAQEASVTFNDIDTSGDGFIDYAEAEAVFGPRGAEGLFRNDADDDGRLSVSELIDGGSAVNSDGDVIDEDGNVIEDVDSSVEFEDTDRGHGNDPDGFDGDNLGQGHDRENGERGGGNGGGSDNGGGSGNGGGNGNAGGNGRGGD